MIKLIASDVDGTLLQDGRQTLTEEQVDLIESCIAQGILFAAASGRQYPSLQKLFAPIKGNMLFIAENGAVIMHNDQQVFSRGVSRDLGIEVIGKIDAYKDHAAIVCCERTCYVQEPMPESLRDEFDRLLYTYTPIDDFEQIDATWLKLSAYAPNGGEAEDVEFYKQDWNEQLYIAQAGNRWIDFGRASKSTALRFLQRHYSITRDETMVFGDNFNDVEMFLSAKYSYAMTSADAAVKEHASYATDTVAEILRTLV